MYKRQDSGSAYEYVDKANRLHFYVLDIHRGRSGVLSYTIAVKSLDGAGQQLRGVKLGRGEAEGDPGRRAVCTFDLTNTGRPGAQNPDDPENLDRYLSSDVYRLSAKVSGRGWSVWLPSRLATAKARGSAEVEVAVSAGQKADRHGKVTLTARSESDPGKSASAVCKVGK